MARAAPRKVRAYSQEFTLTAVRFLRAGVVAAAFVAACGDLAGPGSTYPPRIAFARFQAPGSGAIWVMAPHADSLPQRVDGDWSVTWLDWSPDGHFLVCGIDDHALRVIDVESAEGSYSIAPPGTGVSAVPMWSPDGTRIAFGLANDIWVVDADGSAPVDVSRDPSRLATFPDWSPDGTQIVYETAGELWVATADGSARSRIPIDGSAEFPRWSPDGARIAFGSRGVFTVGLDGSGRRALTPNCTDAGVCDRGSEYGFAQWSPDGTRLAFMGRPDMNQSEYHIFVVNADGTDLRQLTHANDNQDPQWAPDGSAIVFWSSDGAGGNHLATVTFDGWPPRPLTSTSGWHAFPRWRP